MQDRTKYLEFKLCVGKKDCQIFKLETKRLCECFIESIQSHVLRQKLI